MATPVLSALAILPLAWLLANVSYLWLNLRRRSRLSDTRILREFARAGRQETKYDWLYSGLIFAGLLLWVVAHPIAPREIGFRADSAFTQLVWGSMVGTGSVGLLLLVRALLRIRRPLLFIVPALHARSRLRLAVWLVTAFAEELWRALCLVAMLSAGYDSLFALTVVSVVYAIAFAGWQIEVPALGVLNSAIFGTLFLWQRSLFAPVVAHLTMNMAAATMSVFLAPDVAGASERTNVPCPLCASKMSVSAVDTWNAFPCPRCHELLQVPRRYRLLICLPMLLAMVGGWLMFVIPEAPNSLGRVFLTLLIEISAAAVCVAMALNFVPPRLKRGVPNSPSLNLVDSWRPKSKKDLEHGESAAGNSSGTQSKPSE